MCVLYFVFFYLFLFVFFFFKQKTAYEILTCDWSSDVCSSDLLVVRRSTHPPLCNDCMSDVEHNHMKQIPGSDNFLLPECSLHSDLLTKKLETWYTNCPVCF